jgi:hypothetical protein
MLPVFYHGGACANLVLGVILRQLKEIRLLALARANKKTHYHSLANQEVIIGKRRFLDKFSVA